jgi:hypothetical protein
MANLYVAVKCRYVDGVRLSTIFVSKWKNAVIFKVRAMNTWGRN